MTSEESSSTCMICMEEWTIGSEHRICCLKCGHLFGRSCVEKWIKEKGANAKCPTCNKPVKKPDLRDLWCKSIKATDDTELNQLQQALEQERRLRKADAAVLFHQGLKLELLEKELRELNHNIAERDSRISRLQGLIDRINKQRAQNASGVENESDIIELEATNHGDTSVTINVNDIKPRELKGMFHYVNKIESSSIGGCRSFAICPTASIILVAQPAPQGASNVFGGFGLRKYSTLDTSLREFIPLHSKLISSIQLKPVGDLVLTASQDKRVRLTSTYNNTCIQSYQCQFEPSCVAWSAHRDQQFYVASANCFVTLYDMRNTSDYIYQTLQRVANTRLLSAASTSGQEGELHGLVVNDLKGSQFIEVSETSDYENGTIDHSIEHLYRNQLPFDGLLGTVDFYKRLDLTLITTRRSPVSPNCSHNLVKLKKVREEDGTTKINCQPVRTFTGSLAGELLSHSRILRHPTLEDSVLVGACDEAVRGIKLWDSSDNTEYQTIKTGDFVRDMIVHTPENSNQHVLYTLSDKNIGIYRWDYA